MSKKFNFIYKTEHLPTGRYYIGVHSTNDINDGYRGSGKVIQCLLKSHPDSAFITTIICHYNTRLEASDAEAMIVQDFILNRNHFPLILNCKTGGDNGYLPTHTAESKLKCSISAKKALEDPELRARRKVNQKIAQNKPEVKAKRIASYYSNRAANKNFTDNISVATLKVWADPVLRAKMMAARSTPESFIKRSQASKRPCSEATKIKLKAFYAAKRADRLKAKEAL